LFPHAILFNHGAPVFFSGIRGSQSNTSVIEMSENDCSNNVLKGFEDSNSFVKGASCYYLTGG